MATNFMAKLAILPFGTLVFKTDWVIPKLTFLLRLLKGCCYLNQLILGLFADVKIDHFTVCSSIAQ